MKKTLALLFLLLTGGVASAQPYLPCPYVTAGFSKSWTGFAITSMIYDGSTQLLYTIFNSVTPTAMSGVSYTTATNYSRATNPVTFYNTLVTQQHSILLAEGDSCPMLFETGAYIWTR